MPDKRTTLKEFYDEEKIVFGNHPSLVPRYITTGIPELDAFLDGGLRRNSFSLWVGQEGHGKTWTSQKTVGANIQLDHKVCYINLEKAYHPAWWKQTGVDIKKLHVANLNSVEETIDACREMAQADYDLVVVDSSSAFVSGKEEEESAETNNIGLGARLSGRFYRLVNQVNKNTHFFVINQLRETVGMTWGSPIVIPGGKAQRFFSSSIVQCKREKFIPDADKEKRFKGFNLKYEILIKNRGTAKPGDEITIPVLFSGKVDEAAQISSIAISLGIIKKEGAWYHIVDELGEIIKSIQGKDNLTNELSEDEELLKIIRDRIPS